VRNPLSSIFLVSALLCSASLLGAASPSPLPSASKPMPPPGQHLIINIGRFSDANPDHCYLFYIRSFYDDGYTEDGTWPWRPCYSADDDPMAMGSRVPKTFPTPPPGFRLRDPSAITDGGPYILTRLDCWYDPADCRTFIERQRPMANDVLMQPLSPLVPTRPNYPVQRSQYGHLTNEEVIDATRKSQGFEYTLRQQIADSTLHYDAAADRISGVGIGAKLFRVAILPPFLRVDDIYEDVSRVLDCQHRELITYFYNDGSLYISPEFGDPGSAAIAPPGVESPVLAGTLRAKQPNVDSYPVLRVEALNRTTYTTMPARLFRATLGEMVSSASGESAAPIGTTAQSTVVVSDIPVPQLACLKMSIINIWFMQAVRDGMLEPAALSLGDNLRAAGLVRQGPDIPDNLILAVEDETRNPAPPGAQSSRIVKRVTGLRPIGPRDAHLFFMPNIVEASSQ
jgi:hypothetical protein